jgi:4-hydroxybenzoate polyprenyltransferase
VSAFRIARVLHLCSWLFLVGFGVAAGLSYPYFIGLLVFGWALFSQHQLVTPSDLTQMNAAFFTRNGIASCTFFLGTVADFLLLRFG